MTNNTAYDVRLAADRFHTRISWLNSRHSFSFGDHYDPSNTHHGMLLVSNDDVVAPGQGFDTHPHRDMEIVTWVTSGSLVHQDSMGHAGVIHPGLAQRMSAGTGILHSERNDTWRADPHPDSDLEPVRFIQMWLMPDEPGIDPGYDQLDISGHLDSGELLTLASGRPDIDSAIRIANRDAALHVARIRAAGSVTLPSMPFGHLFVVDGTVRVDGVPSTLSTGDAVRIRHGGGERVTADTDAEILVWEMHRGLGQ